MSSLFEEYLICGRIPFVDYIRLVCQKWELMSFDVWNIELFLPIIKRNNFYQIKSGF